MKRGISAALHGPDGVTLRADPLVVERRRDPFQAFGVEPLRRRGTLQHAAQQCALAVE